MVFDDLAPMNPRKIFAAPGPQTLHTIFTLRSLTVTTSCKMGSFRQKGFIN